MRRSTSQMSKTYPTKDVVIENEEEDANK